MFRISEFSRLTRVSAKTLRHYDRLGLLRPAFVDPENQYRYYSAGQVAALQRILALRDAGFALEHIAAILEDDPRGKTLRRLLERRRLESQSRLDEERRRLADVEARLRDLSVGAPAASLDVVLHAVPPVRVASRRERVPELDAAVQELFEALEADVARAGVRAPGPPLLLYHDRDHRESGADVEAAVPVVSSPGRVPGLGIRMLPAIPLAACVTYAGSYAQWSGRTRALASWLQARRLVPAGALREVYLQFSARDADALALPASYLVDREEGLVSELQFPVRNRRRADLARSEVTLPPTRPLRRR